MTKHEKDLVYHAALLATLCKDTDQEKTNTEIIDTVVNYIIKTETQGESNE